MKTRLFFSKQMRKLPVKPMGMVPVWLLGVGMAAFTSSAAPIIFTHTGTGTGTIGSIPFSNAAFTMVETADTDARASYTGGYSIDDLSASISVDGVGNFNFTSGTRTFVNNAQSIVGFSRATVTGYDLFNGPTSAEFATWDMLSSIGPIAGTGELEQWSFVPPVTTDGGVLFFDNLQTSASFQATLVPEPEVTALVWCVVAFHPGRRLFQRLRLGVRS